MVAVKGMKMPKNCMECLLFDGEYGDCNVMGETKADATEERAECCPLIEIVTCKDCTYDGCAKAHSPNFWCADAERRE